MKTYEFCPLPENPEEECLDISSCPEAQEHSAGK